MAHRANDSLGPIIIKGSDATVAFLDLLARYKGRTTRCEVHSRVELQDRNIVVVGRWPATDYLEERYPDPAVLPETPCRRAVVRSLVDQLLDTPEQALPPLYEVIKTGPSHLPFILNDQLTLIDLAVAVVGEGRYWRQYANRIRGIVDKALETQLEVC